MTLIPPTPTLPTSRLLLRPWRDSDRKPFAALNADPEVMAFFPAPLKRAESDAIANKASDLLSTRGWGIWAIERKSDGRFIGMTGLHIPSAPLPFQPCVEILWRLARNAWGQGYATEAAQMAMRHGFETLGLAEIVSFAVVGNARSLRVMERLGMVRDGEFDHPSLPEGSPLRRHVLYRKRADHPHGEPGASDV